MLESIAKFLAENEWIKWIPTLIIVLIMVWWTIHGYLRGFRKSAHKFIALIVSFLIALLCFNLIIGDNGKFIYNLSFVKGPLDSALGVTSPDGTLLGVLREYLLLQVAQQSGGYEQIAIEVYPQIEVWAVILLRLAGFIVSLLIYFIGLLLCLIVYLIVFRESKHKKKLKRLERPYKKRRLAGGAVGFVRGALVSVVFASFIGWLMFSVTSNVKENDKVDFTDPTLQSVYDINRFAQEFGNTGIFGVLNNMKASDKADAAPYYLFFADAILQAKATDYNGEEYTVNARQELASITGLANDLLKLLAKHANNENITTLTGDEILDLLNKLFTKEEFVNDLNGVIDRYQGTEYIKNLTKITVGAVTKNIDSLLGNTEDPTTQNILGFYHHMFDKEYAGDDYLAPEDIANFDDCKILMKSVVSSAPEILDLMDFYNTSKNSPVYQADPMALNINLANKGLNTFTTFYSEIDDMSFLNKEGTKRTKLDGIIHRGISYFFDLMVGESEMPNPFAATKIAWTNELDGFQNAFSTLVSISGEFVKEFEAKYAGNHEFTMQEAMVNVLADNYSNKEIIDTAFDGLTDAVSSYQSVQTLLDSEFFYGVAETKLAEVMQVEEIKIPHNIAWIDNAETEGELRIFLNSIRAAIGKGVLEFVMNKPDFADINNIKELVNILDSSYKDTTLLDYLFNSNLLYYASSIMMLNYKIEGFEILVPDGSCTNIESIKFITRDEILNLVNCLPTVLNEIEDLEVIQNDPIKIVNILQKENVRADIVKSDILTATAAKTINTMALQNPDVSEMLVVPSRLVLDGTKDQENVLAWINTGGELDNLLSILPLLDLEGLMAQDADAIIKLTKMNEKDFNTVVSSDIIHYSFTKILNKLSTPEFSIMIPGDVYDSEYTDAKVIKNTELYTMLKSASSILIKDPTTGNLGYDLNKALENKDVLLDSMILHSTAVKLFVDMSAKPELAETLAIPSDLKDVNYDKFGDSVWVKTKEISHILDAIPLLGIDLNNLNNINPEELTSKVLTLDEKVDPEDSKSVSKVEKLCESRVLSRTLTNTVLNLKDQNNNPMIMVPGEAYDKTLTTATDAYIDSNEWLNLISGIKKGFDLKPTDNLMDKMKDPMILVDGLLTDKVNYISRRDALLKSNMLHATVVNTFLNLVTDPQMAEVIAIPTNYQNDKIDYNKFTESIWYTKHEIANILDVIPLLGIKLSDTSSLDVNTITAKVLTLNETYNGKISKIDKLCESMVLSRTLTNVVANLKNGEEPMVIIPGEAYDKDRTTATDAYISSAEWSNLIAGITDGFKVTGNIEEALANPMDLVDNLLNDKDNYEARRDALLASDMLHATVVNVFLDTVDTPELANTIAIPTEYKITNESFNKFHNTSWYTNHEIANILDVIPLLGIKLSDTSSLDINALTGKILTLNEIYKGKQTKIEKICESRVLSRTLTNTVANLKNGEEPMITIPLEAYDKELSKGEDKYISSLEWSYLIYGITDGFKVTGNIQDALANPMDLVDQLLSDNENYVARRNTLLGSDMLHATIVHVFLDTVNDPNLANTIAIPKEYKVEVNSDTEFHTNIWYKNKEIANILDVIPMLGIKLADTSTLNPTALVDKILTLNDPYIHDKAKTNIEKLCESRVLSRTLTNTVSGLKNGEEPIIIIPKEAYDQDLSKGEDTYISSTEWSKLIAGITDGLGVKENLEAQLKNPMSLVDSLLTDKINYVKRRDALLASDMLHATVVKSFLDTANDPGLKDTLCIPTDYKTAVESNKEFHTNVWYTNHEIANVLDVLPILDINLGNKTGFDSKALTDKLLILNNKYEFDNTKTNIEKLCESRVLSRTLTNTVSNLKNGKESIIIVPKEAYDEKISTATDTYISSTEWSKLISGVTDGLGVKANLEDSLKDPMALIDSLLTDKVNYISRRNALLASDMLHATVVKSFLDTANDPSLKDTLCVPTEYKVAVKANEEFHNNIWYQKHEIANILDVLPILDIKLGSKEGFDSNALTDKLLVLNKAYDYDKSITNIDKLCESRVLSRTLTNAVVNLKDGSKNIISVPEKAYETGTFNKEDSYIKSTEWKNMIDAIEISFGVKANLSDSLKQFDKLISNLFSGTEKEYETKRDTLMSSYILENTLIDTVVETLSGVSMVVMPDVLLANENKLWFATRNDKDIITANGEAMNILDTFKALGIGEALGTPTFDQTVTTNLSMYGLIVVKSDSEATAQAKLDKQAALLKSDVLTASFINIIYDLKGTLSIPKALDYAAGALDSKAELKAKYNDSFSWLTGSVSELQNIFKSINALRLNVTKTEPNTINIDINEILADTKLNAADVLSSQIIHLTVSDLLVKTPSLVFVNGKTITTNSDNERLVNKEEFNSLLKGMQSLFLVDGKVNLNEFKVANLFPADEALYNKNMDTLFASNILEATLFKVVNEALGTFAKMTKETKFTFPAATASVILTGNEENLNNWINLGSESAKDVRELRRIFDVIRSLGIAESIDNPTAHPLEDAVTLSSVMDKIDSVFESTVFGATITKILLGDAKDAFDIPEAIKDEYNEIMTVSPTKEYKNSNLKAETLNIFKSMKGLNIVPKGNDPKFDINSLLNSLNEEAKVNDNLAISSVMYLTVSTKLLAVSALKFTTDVLVDPIASERLIQAKEIANMIKGIQLMGVADINTVSFTPSTILTHIDDLLKSKVLHITISETILILDIAKNALYRDDRISTETLDLISTTAVENIHYLTAIEIKYFLGALGELGISDSFNFDIDFTKLLTTNSEKLYKMIKSDIARNIISNVLVEGGTIPNPIPHASPIKIDYAYVIGKEIEIDKIFTNFDVLVEFKKETGLLSGLTYKLEELKKGGLYDSNHVEATDKTLLGAKEIMGMAYLLANPSHLIG